MGSTRVKRASSSVEDAVSIAFGEMESIKDELEEWYGNLPENFQNGEKGEAIQEAISAIDGAPSEPSVPDCAGELTCEYTEYSGKIGRPKRRDTAVSAARAAADACRAKVEELQAMTFDEPDDPEPEESGAVNGTDLADNDEEEMTEDERDTAVQELEEFAEECENAADEWENVEFPGMYG